MKRKPYSVEPLEPGVPREKCRRWMIRVSAGHDPVTGKRLRPYETFEGTETEANLRAMAMKVERGLVPTTGLTVAEYFVGVYLPWAKSRVRRGSYDGGPRDKGKITRETYRNYEQTVRRSIVPMFGSIGLTDLKPYYVESQLSTIPTIGARRVVYKVLRQGYRRAVKWQLATFVVTDAVDEPMPEKAVKPVVKSSQMWDYIDAFEGDEALAAVVIAFAVGLRRSEILAIDREEIDWSVSTPEALGRFRVWRSYHYMDGEGYFEPPKSFTSARTLLLPRWAGEIVWPLAQGTGPLVVHDGKRMRPDHLSRHWREVTKAAGLPVDMPLKNTRHSCGTMLVREDGLPIADVQQLLGHSTPVVTSEFYVQAGEESVERAVAAMNKRARPTGPNCPKPPKNDGKRPEGNGGNDLKNIVSPGIFKIIKPDFKRASNS
ncbi:hypothetical protein B5F40_01610 [Gordonibacter sp. An230]|uniref:tyrosine-type recombinase/integrase n=1 Tax=Gordonibacter sp. An230 TaxID=1965592 RepID=UPI000B36A8F2|nr:tyrosine-type recombinase/integrase [Gordonibacter sp. An230]OUO92056.1 hypothetical protein B5F40_01610 [Gordonibacter sp. An230]